MQHKNSEKWELIDMEARDAFSRSTPSMIKCAAGMNHYGNRIRIIDNMAVVCPVCGADED